MTYTAEQARSSLQKMHGHPLTVAERAELFSMASNYAALLREHESAKAAVADAVAYWAAISDDGEIVVAYPANDGNKGEAARTECNQYINDALLNDRAVLRLVPLYEAVAPMLASARVPEARKMQLNGNVRQQSYDQGWNACRAAMLTAAGEPKHDA